MAAKKKKTAKRKTAKRKTAPKRRAKKTKRHHTPVTARLKKALGGR